MTFPPGRRSGSLAPACVMRYTDGASLDHVHLPLSLFAPGSLPAIQPGRAMQPGRAGSDNRGCDQPEGAMNPKSRRAFKVKDCARCRSPFTPRGSRATHCSLACRFWSRVSKRGPKECWGWTGGHRTHGYGDVRTDAGRATAASRVSFELHHGPIPDGLHVLHSCDNPPCCNPAHLRLGTPQDNSDDKMKRGRYRHWKTGRDACVAGHPYTPENTRVTVDPRPGQRPYRSCLTCEKSRRARARARDRRRQ